LIKFIIEALNIPDYQVCYVAYTGKAATVLRQKGCPNAITAHKLLYYSKQLPNGHYVRKPKPTLGDYRIIVVDEVSMLPKDMWELLLSHRIHVLATGDPGQLPPINSNSDNRVLEQPHIFLDEIVRQAEDSEIIRLSMWVREGKPLQMFPQKKEQIQIISQSEIHPGMYDWADQILCATNNKRNQINNYMRSCKGFGLEPCVGDKIISLKNHWDDISQSGDFSLTNGEIGTLISFQRESIKVPEYIAGPDPIEVMYSNFEVEDDMFVGIPIDYVALTTGTPRLDAKQAYSLDNSKTALINNPYEFNYAYAITTHKAQGSEWDKVLIFEERFPFDEEEHIKWLYTAITRAKEKVVIVKK
jgi:exodeoxyribonuclease-5